MTSKEIYPASWMNLPKLTLTNLTESMRPCFDENDSVI